MRGWLWKSRQRGETGIQERQRARVGVQMKANHDDCCTIPLRGGKKEKRRKKKLNRLDEKM